MQPSFISKSTRPDRRRTRPPGDTPSPRPLPGPRRPASRHKLWMRRAHALAGIVLSLNMLLIVLSGFLLQHVDTFRLDERTVGRGLLPADYRPQDGAAVRADIAVADLHSGRVLGPAGRRIVDGLALGWFLLLLSGVVLYFVGRWRKENGFHGNGENGWERRD